MLKASELISNRCEFRKFGTNLFDFVLNLARFDAD
jgi:hypothetical protein